MHEEMQSLLTAYMDGELHGWRLQQMDAHLAACEVCRNELIEMRQLSDLVRTSPAPEFLPVDRFVSNLTLNLPRLPKHDLPAKGTTWVWWLVPAGLLGAWFFMQTVFTLTDVVTTANLTGLLGHASSWLGGGQDAIWFHAASSMFGRQVVTLPSISLLNNMSIFGANLLSGLFWEAVIGLLYCSWLVIWLLRRIPPTLKSENVA
jgi:hypothetical protein